VTGQLPPQPTAPQMPPTPPYQATMPPPPRPQRSSAWRWGCGIAIAAVLLGVMGILLVLLMVAMGTIEGLGELAPGGRIAVVRIDGMIVAGQSGFSMLGGAACGSDDVVREIERAVDDGEVEGILLRVNSPGGSAAGSQEIYRAVQRASEARDGSFVVVVSMADVAASGGYYVAAAADEIFADEATMTGSIGAIALHQDMSGLFDKIGVKPEVIKSGELKDMLSPATPMTEEARQIVQALVEQVHEQFILAVAEGRENLDLAAVNALADGRVYTGQQALENGLVDGIGGYREALDRAGELTGLGPDPRVKEYAAPSLLHYLLSGSAGGSQRIAAQPRLTATGGLLYDELSARLVGQAAARAGDIGAAEAAPAASTAPQR